MYSSSAPTDWTSACSSFSWSGLLQCKLALSTISTERGRRRASHGLRCGSTHFLNISIHSSRSTALGRRAVGLLASSWICQSTKPLKSKQASTVQARPRCGESGTMEG